jgi:hypothetical protein
MSQAKKPSFFKKLGFYTAHGHKLNFFNKVGGQEKDFFEVLVFLKKKLKPRNHPTKSSPKKV